MTEQAEVVGSVETTTPDVTVIVPVYNTMPYLTACLDSMVKQTIGMSRLHVIAVDDGSTDGSGEQLERYASRYPDLFTVVHQENSGGPAAPCNRGLELATGRFVFFLGADDYLGERALEKLVAKADEWDSDVVIGKMEGVGGRFVSQQLFDRDEPDLPFPHSKLPFVVANTKLFRRSLLEEYAIRYSLDLSVGSDQPFTIEAMLHARRISVLADDTYYYAVRRHDAQNISFTSTWHARLGAIGKVMDHVAALVEPGDDRDAILHRHFAWEISKTLRADFLSIDEEEQKELCAEVGRLADQYLTDGVSRRLRASARARIRMAQAGLLDSLRRVIAFEQAEEQPVLALTSDKVCLAYPGFGEHPAEWFEAVVEHTRTRCQEAVRLSSVAWEGPTLVLGAEARLHPVSAERVRVVLAPVHRAKGVLPFRRLPEDKPAQGLASPVVLDQGGGQGSRLTARVDATPLVEGSAGPKMRWAVRFHLDAGERTFDLPAEGAPGATGQARVGRKFFQLVAKRNQSGLMFVTRTPVPLKKVLRAELDRVLRRG